MSLQGPFATAARPTTVGHEQTFDAVARFDHPREQESDSMAITMYCWRCKADVPMLTEEEWQTVNPISYIEQVKTYREETGCTLAEAQKGGLGYLSLAAYERITGFKETNPNALLHHRASLYGPPCHECGKPLRTPAANFCAACSAERLR